MHPLIVRANQLSIGDKTYRCAIGKSGVTSNKKEGDGCTPLGIFLLRECWYRADRIAKPTTLLPLHVIQPNDGWCDDPASNSYNRHFKLMSPSGNCGHENLWRDDHVYDLIIPLGYNDDPVISGKGSAIFLHIAKPDYTPTEGCVALACDDLLTILPLLGPQTTLEIRET